MFKSTFRIIILSASSAFIFLALREWVVVKKTGDSPLVQRIAEFESVTKEDIAKSIGESGGIYPFPKELNFISSLGNKVTAVPFYTFDIALQRHIEDQFKQYNPDYGSFVAIDASKGRILAMVSYKGEGNLALRATFPAASVFKVITAAAAIGDKKFNAQSTIAFNGANHTLYKNHVLKNEFNRWTRRMSLQEAFAKSVNTVFGKIGAFGVGPARLQEYADRFGFNRPIQADVPVEIGRAKIPTDAWGAAEHASGFTQENTMSPLHGALIAAAIVNDGKMREPYIIQEMRSLDGRIFYEAGEQDQSEVIDSTTASELRDLMRETVSTGTPRGSFKKFFNGKFEAIDIGGKTGSLSGTSPPGKYDWFVGFATGGGQRLAFCALTINKNHWKVKSALLARRAIEFYIGSKI